MHEVVQVQDLESAQRIDIYLSNNTKYSRSKIAVLIKEKKVRCNGQLVKANHKVNNGDTINVGAYVPKTSHIEAIEMELAIIFEDEHLLVVDKPRGLAVHAGKGIYTPTLINGLYNHIKPSKPGLVHRIDKNTSGLLVVAKNDTVHNYLANQLSDKTMSRHYLAIVEGCIEEPFKIDMPLSIDPSDSRKMCVDSGGKQAITLVSPVKSNKTHSLIRCELLTGRTHQIRIHLAANGYPIIEDNIYNKNYPDGSGQYLFAYHLEFKHPESENLLVFETEMPEYFQTKLRELKL